MTDFESRIRADHISQESRPDDFASVPKAEHVFRLRDSDCRVAWVCRHCWHGQQIPTDDPRSKGQRTFPKQAGFNSNDHEGVQ